MNGVLNKSSNVFKISCILFIHVGYWKVKNVQNHRHNYMYITNKYNFLHETYRLNLTLFRARITYICKVLMILLRETKIIN